MSDDDTLLSRWSRRKRAALAEQAASDPAGATSASAPSEDGPQGTKEGLSESELLEKLGLPDPDTLTKGDDFSAFMQANVPDFLRRRALRKLWLSDPVLANLDGLIDHGEDYTDAAMVPDTLKTAYRVGKGIVRHIVEPEPETEETSIPEPVVAEADAGADPDQTLASPPEPDDTDDDETTPRPRRMAFRTD